MSRTYLWSSGNVWRKGEGGGTASADACDAGGVLSGVDGAVFHRIGEVVLCSDVWICRCMMEVNVMLYARINEGELQKQTLMRAPTGADRTQERRQEPRKTAALHDCGSHVNLRLQKSGKVHRRKL